MKTYEACLGAPSLPGHFLTLAGLLSGQESPRYPDLSLGGLSFKKAKPEAETGEQGKLF